MDDLLRIVDDTLVPHPAFEEATRRMAQCFEYAKVGREPVGIAILGESRTGKSRSIEEFQAKHCPTRTEEGVETPVLRVVTPAKPTTKGLAESLLRAMGDPKADRGTEQAKTARIATLMRACGTRMLVIDEFQHFYDRGSEKVIHDVANWLKNLVDETRVALVVAGLPYCEAVLEQNEQLAGRFLAPIRMPRFAWTNAESREHFIDILGAFSARLEERFDLPRLDSEEMALRCYCATGGLMGYLAKFLRQAVLDAAAASANAITLADLAQASHEAVWKSAALADMPNPFSVDFALSDAILERVATIGAAPLPVALGGGRRGRRRAFREKASAVLAA